MAHTAVVLCSLLEELGGLQLLPLLQTALLPPPYLKAIAVKPSEYYVNADYPQTDERWKKDEMLAAKIKKFLSVSE